ncbi:MAG: hypothetical protein COA45_12165 [Zetaproteobacteria bacterium]|nr:MAG: hypothetical protein COA45_12165 [Zetaproteobacteria bacterium]
MSKYMSQYKASDLLNKLSKKGFINDGDEDINRFIIEQQQDKELPLYLRALVGVGAFIASLCFIGFIAIGMEIREEEGFVIAGLVLIALAIGLQKLGGGGHTIKGSFYMQSSFALMATGKTLFTFGMAEILGSGWGATIALLVITAATYHIYRMSVDRFLSTFAVLFSILVNVLWDREFAGSRELLFNGFILLQILGAAVLITNVKIKRDYIPMTYGILFSLCTSALFLASYTKFGYWRHEEYINPIFVSLLFTGSLVASIIWFVGGVRKINTETSRLACLGAVLMGVISAPGIILSIILMVLGYAKHEKIMVTMGALLVPVFLFFYYYNLDISLMEKSGVLVGSGITLLVGRFYIGFKGWDKGGNA